MFKILVPLFVTYLVKTATSVCPSIAEEILDYSLNLYNQADPKLIEALQHHQYLRRPNGKPLNLTKPTSSKNLGGQFGQPYFLDEKYFK